MEDGEGEIGWREGRRVEKKLKTFDFAGKKTKASLACTPGAFGATLVLGWTSGLVAFNTFT